jgi:23S rRNA G2069 N7-methylase RlmK/C1962 C5-methylase RlmI
MQFSRYRAAEVAWEASALENDQGSDIEKQQIFRLRYRAAVDQHAAHASDDKAVSFYVVHGEAAGKHAIVIDQCGPGPPRWSAPNDLPARATSATAASPFARTKMRCVAKRCQ